MAWNTKNGGVIQLFTSESLRRINAALLPFLFSPLHGGCRFYACFAVLLPREITPHGETASSLSVPPQFLLAGASSSATLSSSSLQVLLSREITPHGETASSLSVPPQFLLAGTPRLRRSPPGDRLYGLGALRRGGPCRDRWLQELFHECNGSSSPGLNCPILCMESSGRENRSFTYSLHRMIRLVLFRIGEQDRPASAGSLEHILCRLRQGSLFLYAIVAERNRFHEPPFGRIACSGFRKKNESTDRP